MVHEGEKRHDSRKTQDEFNCISNTININKVGLPTQRKGFLGSLVVKNLPADPGDVGWIPGSGRSSEGGNGNPL